VKNDFSCNLEIVYYVLTDYQNYLVPG